MSKINLYFTSAKNDNGIIIEVNMEVIDDLQGIGISTDAKIKTSNPPKPWNLKAASCCQSSTTYKYTYSCPNYEIERAVRDLKAFIRTLIFNMKIPLKLSQIANLEINLVESNTAFSSVGFVDIDEHFYPRSPWSSSQLPSLTQKSTALVCSIKKAANVKINISSTPTNEVNVTIVVSSDRRDEVTSIGDEVKKLMDKFIDPDWQREYILTLPEPDSNIYKYLYKPKKTGIIDIDIASDDAMKQHIRIHLLSEKTEREVYLQSLLEDLTFKLKTPANKLTTQSIASSSSSSSSSSTFITSSSSSSNSSSSRTILSLSSTQPHADNAMLSSSSSSQAITTISSSSSSVYSSSTTTPISESSRSLTPVTTSSQYSSQSFSLNNTMQNTATIMSPFPPGSFFPSSSPSAFPQLSSPSLGTLSTLQFPGCCSQSPMHGYPYPMSLHPISFYGALQVPPPVRTSLQAAQTSNSSSLPFLPGNYTQPPEFYPTNPMSLPPLLPFPPAATVPPPVSFPMRTTQNGTTNVSFNMLSFLPAPLPAQQSETNPSFTPSSASQSSTLQRMECQTSPPSMQPSVRTTSLSPSLPQPPLQTQLPATNPLSTPSNINQSSTLPKTTNPPMLPGAKTTLFSPSLPLPRQSPRAPLQPPTMVDFLNTMGSIQHPAGINRAAAPFSAFFPMPSPIPSPTTPLSAPRSSAAPR